MRDNSTHTAWATCLTVRKKHIMKQPSETVTSILSNMEAAEQAAQRVAAEIDAVSLDELAPMNLDVVSGASIILGVAHRILAFRDRMVKLPEFEIRNVDNLKDYAISAWFTHISNLPPPEPADAEALIVEGLALRGKFLLWATPLVASGIFDAAAVDKIKEGAGQKDSASDVVALVGLYRSKWDQVKDMCGVTEADLERGALIGPRIFLLVSQREHRKTTGGTEGSQRVRRAWTLADRAYAQCRRALMYLLQDPDEVDAIAPALRRNSGTSSKSSKPTEPAPAAAREQANVVPAAPAAGDAIGNRDSPFGAKG